MKRFVRILACGLFSALWLAVAGVGLEVWERYRALRIERAAKAYGEPRMAQGYARNATATRTMSTTRTGVAPRESRWDRRVLGCPEHGLCVIKDLRRAYRHFCSPTG